MDLVTIDKYKEIINLEMSFQTLVLCLKSGPSSVPVSINEMTIINT
jgi:hypothetical protein